MAATQWQKAERGKIVRVLRQLLLKAARLGGGSKISLGDKFARAAVGQRWPRRPWWQRMAARRVAARPLARVGARGPSSGGGATRVGDGGGDAMVRWRRWLPFPTCTASSSRGGDGRRVATGFAEGRGERRGEIVGGAWFCGRRGKWADGVTAGPTEVTVGARTPGRRAGATSRARAPL
jgi:hypothetical protein